MTFADSGTSGGSTRFSRTRGRIQGGGGYGVAYPHPFFDLATTYMPTSMKSLFRWLRHYFLLNGFFNTVISKLAEYPVTDLLFEAQNPEESRKWKQFFEDHLHYRLFQVEVGLDYFVYGNAFVSLRYPFTKFLQCSNDQCRWEMAARSCRKNWTFSGHDFRLTCPKCGHVGPAKVQDVSTKSAAGARLIRWSPEAITIRYNEVSGHKTFYYDIPNHLRNDITLGRKHVVEEIPQVFIDAVRRNVSVVIPSEGLFHMARPSISGFDRGWGIPLLLPVLKEGFQMQVLRKANEVVLMEHLQPLRVMFPQPAAGTADPFASVPLSLWKEQVSQEVARWRWDPAYIPIMPLPIGQQTIGGDGKALLLDQQIQSLAESIVVQIGVPKEIIFGGASWSGGNVAMRAVENFFLGYLSEHHALLRFITQQLRVTLNWPEVDARFKPFRMADDVQQTQLLMQLNQMNKISDTTLLSRLDLDSREENASMLREIDGRTEVFRKTQVEMAKVQNDVQAIAAKGQAALMQQQQAAQQGPVPGEAGAPEGPVDPAQQQQAAAPPSPPASGVNALGMPLDPTQQFDAAVTSQLNAGMTNRPAIPLEQLASFYAQQIANMSPQGGNEILASLQQSSPDLYALVQQKLSELQAGGGSAGAPQPGQGSVDMRPMPQQRPPRRLSLNGAAA